MERSLYRIVLFPLLIVGICLAISDAAVKQIMPERKPLVKEGFGVSFSVDKSVYTSGDSILMTIYIFNFTAQEVIFHFNNARRFDFFIESEEGKELWRWSDGRMFAQVLGEETLGPGREEITYTASYKGKLEPGIYKITGILVDKEKPMSGSITVEVK